MLRMMVMSVLCLLFSLGFSGYELASQTDTDSPEVTGRIAYIGADHNVYVLDVMTDDVTALTEDAAEQRRYEWPTWSRSGDLAYFCCNPRFSSEIGLEVHFAESGSTPASMIYESATELLTYAYWAPLACNSSISDVCGGLALLLTQTDDDEFRVRIVNQNAANLNMGTGAPFYYSWSPDGTRLIAHRNNDELSIFSLTSGAYTPLNAVPGRIQAPAWSPVDDRILVGVEGENGGTTDLTILAGDEGVLLVEQLRGIVSYNWSPDGNRVAYRVLTTEGYEQLVVLDAVTGEFIASTSHTGVVAFFWSPDSQLIAYVTLEGLPGSLSARSTMFQQSQQRLVWSVLDVSANSATRYASFLPTSEMIYFLNFFDQFAQSHRIWSPGSEYILFSERTIDGTPVVSALDATRADAVPFLITEGYIGIWSYD